MTLWMRSRTRLVGMCALVLIATAGSGYAMLVPSLYVLTGESNDSVAIGLPENVPDVSADIKKASELASVLETASSTSGVFDALRFALEARPSGIFVSDITYTRGTSAKAGKKISESMLVLSGYASHRDDTNAYVAKLQTYPNFASVKVPVASLLESDSRVTITLTGTF